MNWLRKLWRTWWFFIPISFIIWTVLILAICALFGFDYYKGGQFTFLLWIGGILNRYWWNKKKKK